MKTSFLVVALVPILVLSSPAQTVDVFHVNEDGRTVREKEAIQLPALFDLSAVKPSDGKTRRLFAPWEPKERIILSDSDISTWISDFHRSLYEAFQKHLGNPFLTMFIRTWDDPKNRWRDDMIEHHTHLFSEYGFSKNQIILTGEKSFVRGFPRNEFPLSIETTDSRGMKDIQFVVNPKQELAWRAFCSNGANREYCLPIREIKISFEVDGGLLLANGKGLCLTDEEFFRRNSSFAPITLVAELKRVFGCERVLAMLGVLNYINNDTDMSFKFLPGDQLIVAKPATSDPNSVRMSKDVQWLRRWAETGLLNLRVFEFPLIWFTIDSRDGYYLKTKVLQPRYQDYINSFTWDDNVIFIPSFFSESRYNWLQKEHCTAKWPMNDPELTITSGNCLELFRRMNQFAIEFFGRRGFKTVVPVDATPQLRSGGAISCMVNEIFSVDGLF